VQREDLTSKCLTVEVELANCGGVGDAKLWSRREEGGDGDDVAAVLGVLAVKLGLPEPVAAERPACRAADVREDVEGREERVEASDRGVGDLPTVAAAYTKKSVVDPMYRKQGRQGIHLMYELQKEEIKRKSRREPMTGLSASRRVPSARACFKEVQRAGSCWRSKLFEEAPTSAADVRRLARPGGRLTRGIGRRGARAT
jgi:hypothetical protein